MLPYAKKFDDLEVYQRLYQLMLDIHRKVVPQLPASEKYKLCDQLSRASQAAPALLAEGFAKRFQPRHWDKYLTDAIGESQEMIHHMTCVKDLYNDYVNKELCVTLIDGYSISIKQLYSFGGSLKDMHAQRKFSP